MGDNCSSHDSCCGMVGCAFEGELFMMGSGSMSRVLRNRRISTIEGRRQVTSSAMQHPKLAAKLARKVWGEVCEQMPSGTEEKVKQ